MNSFNDLLHLSNTFLDSTILDNLDDSLIFSIATLSLTHISLQSFFKCSPDLLSCLSIFFEIPSIIFSGDFSKSSIFLQFEKISLAESVQYFIMSICIVRLVSIIFFLNDSSSYIFKMRFDLNPSFTTPPISDAFLFWLEMLILTFLKYEPLNPSILLSMSASFFLVA